jgi:hypothetical protein
MSITPKAIQDLLDELESSKQSRLRAWDVLQRFRLALSEVGNVQIPPPAQKTLDAKGEALEPALTKFFRIRDEAIKNLSRYAVAAVNKSPVIVRPSRGWCGKAEKNYQPGRLR